MIEENRYKEFLRHNGWYLKKPLGAVASRQDKKTKIPQAGVSDPRDRLPRNHTKPWK